MDNTTKRNTAITATIVTNGTDERPCALHLKFADGKELAITASQLTNSVREYAIFHGLKQKLVDAAAISCNPETGRAASVEDKYQAVKTVYDRLLAGSWNAVREGGGATGGLLLHALHRMYAGRKTADELKTFLADKSDAEKTALRKNPRVAKIIEEIRAKTGKVAKIDTDKMLGELDKER